MYVFGLQCTNEYIHLTPSESAGGPPGDLPPGRDGTGVDGTVRRAFVDAAGRAADAGFDYLQLHAGHGSLLSAFLSPATNRREDGFGGPLEARLRFPLEVVEAVRDAWPSAAPLGVTLQAADWVADGLVLDEAFAVARRFAEAGVDVIAPVAGAVGTAERPPRHEDVSGYSDHLRHEVTVPTMATPHTTDVDKVDTLVGTGRADLCTFDGRPEDASGPRTGR